MFQVSPHLVGFGCPPRLVPKTLTDDPELTLMQLLDEVSQALSLTSADALCQIASAVKPRSDSAATLIS